MTKQEVSAVNMSVNSGHSIVQLTGSIYLFLFCNNAITTYVNDELSLNNLKMTRKEAAVAWLKLACD